MKKNRQLPNNRNHYVMQDEELNKEQKCSLPVVIPEFNSIPAEKWAAGNASIQEVLNCISPTYKSEDYRRDVIAYMQRVIKNAVGVEVFAYGSGPLKTYLPEGDIDLTVISTPDIQDSLPDRIYQVLLAEVQNRNAEFKIKNPKFINAEVKLVKCKVGGIVVDLSFNQLGGLRSLCFLEQVDRLIKKDHLFKRSIIMIKAWAYHESHILGAYYGLLSTYALETLALYIFHVHNASLTDPLMVLYRFLEYYSNFDWRRFCLSIDGPITFDSQHHMIVKNPINHPLVNGEYLRNYVNMFAVPSYETNWRPFTKKCINIIDPLKENNNIGRSVYKKRNFNHIMTAIRLGALRIGNIMQLPSEKIEAGIKCLFKNTLQKHQPGRIPEHGIELRSLASLPVSEVDYEDDYSNDDLDNHKSRINDVPIYEALSKANDLSTFGLHPDYKPDDDLILIDLEGDFDGDIRNLAYSQCCQGFMLNGPLFFAVYQPVPYGGYEPYWAVGNQSDEWFYQDPYWPQVNPNGAPVQSGLSHGSRPFIPTKGGPSMGGMGRGRGQTNPNHQLRRAGGVSGETSQAGGARFPPNRGHTCGPSHGHGGGPSRVHAQRKLAFGSFGPHWGTTFDEGFEAYNRARGKGLQLKDENDFPPLSIRGN